MTRVRIEPRNPPPPVNFREWDGLTRIAFVRKNKTLGSAFSQTAVLMMLEKNYKVHCSLNDQIVAEDFNVKEVVDEAGVESCIRHRVSHPPRIVLGDAIHFDFAQGRHDDDRLDLGDGEGHESRVSPSVRRFSNRLQ